jgi:kynurenine formamidase
VIDLTQPLTPEIPRFPGDPEVRITPLPGFEPWQVSALSLGTHSGTHMDAPRHRFPEGAGIGHYGPDRLIGRGLVVEARGLGRNESIAATVLDDLRDQVSPGWFAIVRTGWDAYWDDPRYFEHPYLSPVLAQELVDLGARIVAIDTLSVDSTVDSGSEAHRILLGADVLIAENLCHLNALARGQPYTFAFMPLRIAEADGSPARVVAWHQDETSR